MNVSTPKVEIASNPVVAGESREAGDEVVGEFDMLYWGGGDDTLAKDEVEGDFREGRAGTEGQKEVPEVPLEVKLTITLVKELGEGSDIKEEMKTHESIKGLRELTGIDGRTNL